jgi:tRNA(Ile)-lysidine synthase
MSVSGTPGDWRQFQLVETVTALAGAVPLRLGVAVSGGGDSMALLRMAQAAAGAAGWEVRAVTVDHGLRPEAADEAAFVGRVCAGLGVTHDVLRWEGPRDTGNLMDQARRARLRLIAGWARGAGVGHVVLGHTADDQGETFLMRLARGSGIDGLSAMRAVWEEGDVTWLRPLLGHLRRDLRGYLEAIGQAWIEDPTNDDEGFERVRVRRAMPGLAGIGLDASVLSQVARHLAAARDALDTWCREVAEPVLRVEGGDAVIPHDVLKRAHPEVRRRLVLRMLRWVATADYAPVASKLEKLDASIVEGRAHTLHGCLVRVAGGEARFTREAAAVAGVVARTGEVWDGRWLVEGPPGEVRALGAAVAEVPDWRAAGLPRATLMASPGVWRGDALVAAPVAGYGREWSARIVAPFWH